MTMIIDHRPYRERFSSRTGLLHASVTVVANVTGWLSRQRVELARRRTARELESLPFDVRKDIGWPADDTSRSGKA
jgi:hypothetical protein